MVLVHYSTASSNPLLQTMLLQKESPFAFGSAAVETGAVWLIVYFVSFACILLHDALEQLLSWRCPGFSNLFLKNRLVNFSIPDSSSIVLVLRLLLVCI